MTEPIDLAVLLRQFRTNAVGVVHALAVSADGLVLAHTPGLDTADADRLAAVASGLSSLLRGAAQMLGGATVVTNLTELDNGSLLMSPVSAGACLFVIADRKADLAAVAFDMTQLVNTVGHALTPAARDVAVSGGGRP